MMVVHARGFIAVKGLKMISRTQLIVMVGIATTSIAVMTNSILQYEHTKSIIAQQNQAIEQQYNWHCSKNPDTPDSAWLVVTDASGKVTEVLPLHAKTLTCEKTNFDNSQAFAVILANGQSRVFYESGGAYLYLYFGPKPAVQGG